MSQLGVCTFWSTKYDYNLNGQWKKIHRLDVDYLENAARFTHYAQTTLYPTNWVTMCTRAHVLIAHVFMRTSVFSS